MDVKNSAGYQPGVFYERLLRNKLAIETEINFGYGRLNHVTILNPNDFNTPWKALINSPCHFIKGIFPVNIVFKQHFN